MSAIVGKRIAIVGGGPGGLTLARLLQQTGAQESNYEPGSALGEQKLRIASASYNALPIRLLSQSANRDHVGRRLIGELAGESFVPLAGHVQEPNKFKLISKPI